MNLEKLTSDFENNKRNYGLEIEPKKEQLEIALSVLQNRNVLGVLPTGYGKTMCMVIPTIVSERDTITLIISPLTALMDDQIEKLHSMHLSAVKLEPLECMEKKVINDIREGQYQVILSSPETAVKTFWKDVFMSDIWQERLILFAVDEAHCISDWGEEFRPDYRYLHELRSILNVPVMALTATTTSKVKKDIFTHLHLDDISSDVVSLKPDRPNIFLDFKKKSTRTFVESLEWLINYLKDKKNLCKKMIVFCRSVDTVASMFISIKAALGEDAYVGGIKDSKHLIVEMYHKSTHDNSKRRILENFKSQDGNIRCLFATSALGMGVDIPDIDVIIHIGSPKSVLSYWQEVGRGARDGRNGYSLVLYDNFSLSLKTTEACIVNVIRNSESKCYRQMVMNQFVGSEKDNETSGECDGCDEDVCVCLACRCCSVCRDRCPCQNRVQFDIQKFLSD